MYRGYNHSYPFDKGIYRGYISIYNYSRGPPCRNEPTILREETKTVILQGLVPWRVIRWLPWALSMQAQGPRNKNALFGDGDSLGMALING